MNSRFISLLCVFLMLFGVLMVYIPSVSATAWYDSNWLYRKEISIGNKQTGDQLLLIVADTTATVYNLTCNGHSNNDFSDLFFTDDTNTVIPYWIQNYTTATRCNVYVNNSYGTSNIYMYYGNAVATSTSNGNTTFWGFDDFNGTSRNTHKWGLTGTPSLVYLNSELTFVNSGTSQYLTYYKSFGKNYEIVYKLHEVSTFRSAGEGFGLDPTGEKTPPFFSEDTNGLAVTTQYCADGSAYQQGGNINNCNVYYFARFCRYSNRCTYYKNDTKSLDATLNNPSGSLYPSLGVYTYGQTSAPWQHEVYDFMFVKKFFDVEPQWTSFGGEETGNTVTQSSPSPSNGATLVYRHPIVTINVIESMGHTMNVNFKSNLSGSYVSFGSNLTVNDGTYRQHFYGAILYNHKYWWSVNLTDSTVFHIWSNVSYTFTTRPDYAPTITITIPINESISGSTPIGMYYSQPDISISLTDPEGDLMNVSYKCNHSGTYTKIGGRSGVGNGSYVNSSSYFTSTNQTYWESVNLTDNHSNWHNFSIRFYLWHMPSATVTTYENIANAIGTHEYNIIGNHINTWANYSSDALFINGLLNTNFSYALRWNPILGRWNIFVNGSQNESLHNNSVNASLSHTYTWYDLGSMISSYTGHVYGYFKDWANVTGSTTPLHVTNSTDHAVPLHYTNFNSTGWWLTDADFTHAYYSNYNTNVTGSSYFIWTPGDGWTLINSYTGVTTPIHITNSTDHAVPLHLIVFNSTGWWITDEDFCHAGYTPIIVNCTGSTYFTWIPGYGYSFVDSYTGITTPLHFRNNTQNVTKHILIKFNSTGWWAFNNDTGNLTALHLINTSSGVSGYITQIQNATGYWITVHLIGTGGNGTIYTVKINLKDIMNFKNWSGSYTSTSENITFPVTHNMNITANGDTIISLSMQRLSIIVLLFMTLFFLYMGYSMSDRKQGAWFLIFGSFLVLSLMMAVLMFSGVWWFVSPVFILFSVIVMRDGITLLIKGKKYRRN